MNAYDELKWIVEVRTTGGGGGQWWEVIAAFNVDAVAEHYADDCAKANRHLAYRVRERRDNGGWSTVHEVAS